MFQDEQSISFGYYDNSSASTVFNKVLQWGKIASQNNVESFQKPIESVPQNLEYKYEFYWNKDNAVAGLTGSRTETYVPFDQSGKISKNISSWPQYVSKFTFDQKSMVHFLELMQSLPELRQELADKIYKQKKQQDMFH
jgi:hypothetical protein